MNEYYKIMLIVSFVFSVGSIVCLWLVTITLDNINKTIETLYKNNASSNNLRNDVFELQAERIDRNRFEIGKLESSIDKIIDMKFKEIKKEITKPRKKSK